MSQILGRPGLMMAALAAASLSGLGGSADVLKPRHLGQSYAKNASRGWTRKPGSPNPAGTKLARQAAGAACTLRGRKPNGSYMR